MLKRVLIQKKLVDKLEFLLKMIIELLGLGLVILDCLFISGRNQHLYRLNLKMIRWRYLKMHIMQLKEILHNMRVIFIEQQSKFKKK